MPTSGVMPMPPATSRYCGAVADSSKWLAGSPIASSAPVFERPQMARAAAARLEALDGDPVRPARSRLGRQPDQRVRGEFRRVRRKRHLHAQMAARRPRAARRVRARARTRARVGVRSRRARTRAACQRCVVMHVRSPQRPMRRRIRLAPGTSCKVWWLCSASRRLRCAMRRVLAHQRLGARAFALHDRLDHAAVLLLRDDQGVARMFGRSPAPSRSRSATRTAASSARSIWRATSVAARHLGEQRVERAVLLDIAVERRHR